MNPQSNQYPTHKLPVKVAQFGEGNFLRAFIDWMIHLMNREKLFNGSITIIQPIEKGQINLLNSQNGQFHHILQGISNQKMVDEVVLNTSISRSIDPHLDIAPFYELAEEEQLSLVFSNTTEAGIVFQPEPYSSNSIAKTFPAKLTQFLKHRFEFFHGEKHGLGVIPCELIENNGNQLKDAVLQYIDLWEFDSSFKEWVTGQCFFCNTLVDRIVPGYPKAETKALSKRLTFEDVLAVKSEIFHLFVVQGPEKLKQLFPVEALGLNVKFVSDIGPYRTQKVRILNGAHTAMVPVGLLYGLETVREVVNHSIVGTFIKETIFDEIVPSIDIPHEDPHVFAEEVIDRFQNPFIRHELRSISLNSIDKFKVRVLPSLLQFVERNNKLPSHLVFSFASLIALYRSPGFDPQDDARYIRFFKETKSLERSKFIQLLLSNQDFWGKKLLQIPDLNELLTQHLTDIENGMFKNTLSTLISAKV